MLKTAVNLGEANFDETKFKIVCAFLINCTYEASEFGPQHLLGSTGPGAPNGPAKGDLKTSGSSAPALTPDGEGFLCPEEIVWDAFYGSLTPVWIKS